MDESAGGGVLLFVVNVAWFFASHRMVLAKAAIAAGYRVHLASDIEEDAEIAQIEREGIQFHRVHLARSGLNPFAELRTKGELRAVLRLVRPDLVHNVTAKPVVYGSRIAQQQRVRGIVNAMSGFGYAYSAGPRRRLLRRLLDASYARAFAPHNVRVIVQNEDDYADVVRICPAAASRVSLIRGSGVDLTEFKYSPETQSPPVVTLPARLLREKGIREFAEAARQLRADGVAARFLLAGRLDPGNRGGLQLQEVQALCADSGVEWIGECHDMPRLLRDSHIVCLPSYREGMPKVLLEACASGRPVITSDAPGCRDVVRSGLNGLLVPPRNAKALADAIRQLVLDGVQRRQMGLQARRVAEHEFGVAGIVLAHLAIYRDLMAGAVN